MPKLEDWEIKKFWEIFSSLNPVDKKLSGNQVSALFKNSQLSDDKLSKVWSLSDIDQDGSLDFEEFCIAMKLIFDTVNGSLSEIPSSLPPWLIPGLKAHLLQANNALSKPSLDEDDDGYGLRDANFDWYILPTDKATYERIYGLATDRLGRVKFDALSGLYADLNIPATDLSSAWNLVNPKQFETIDKDQCLVYLHILNQRSKGRNVPSSVPASLRATFLKEVPDYSLERQEAKMKAAKKATKSEGFGLGYLSKYGAETTKKEYTELETEEWEEARLRKKIAELDEKIQTTEKALEKNNTPDETSIVRYELEQLLKYKEAEVLRARTGGIGSELEKLRLDVTDIESQVTALEDYLRTKEKELEELRV